MRARTSKLDAVTLALVMLSIASSVTAQLLLRLGMADLAEVAGARLYFDAFSAWPVPTGILCYAVGTGIWLLVLSRLDLAVAYPLGSFNYVLVTIFSATLLGETVNGLRWLGTTLIFAGILVIAIGERESEVRSR